MNCADWLAGLVFSINQILRTYSSVTVPDLSRQTNELCEEYRSRWTAATSGAASVADFISGSSSLAEGDRSVLVRIIQVDIEQSWSHWSSAAEELVRQATSADALVERWKQLPRFQNYAALFSGPEEMCRYWAQLANVEAVCRDRWGDAIGTQFYQHYFEVATEGLARRQRRHLRCEFDHNEDYSQVLFPLRGRNEIGRQRSRDTEPYFYESNPDGNRIVVANRYESEVSREQLTLQLMTPSVAVIANRSNVNSIRLAHDKRVTPRIQGLRSLSLYDSNSRPKTLLLLN